MALLLLHLPTLALNSMTTLVYPLYSSYKAVTDTGTTLAEMETWLVYWSVYACWTLLESMLGFLWSWIPFYYELRLAFNIWLVAPQTKGAMYLYVNHLHPFLRDNQTHIDQLIEHSRQGFRGKAQDVLGSLWGLGGGAAAAAVAAASGGAGGAASATGPDSGVAAPSRTARHAPPGSTAPVVGSTPAPPTQHNPAQAPTSLLGGLFRQYGPAAMATAKQLFDSTNTNPGAPEVGPTTAYSIPSSSTEDVKRKNNAALQRRRELERQLAALDGNTTTTSSSDDDSAAVPVTLLPNKSSPRSSYPSFGVASGAGAAMRNRQRDTSSTGATIGRSAGGIAAKSLGTGARGPLGESYDFLDNDDPSSNNHFPPQQQQQGQTRRTSRSWIPWSPSSGSSPASRQ